MRGRSSTPMERTPLALSYKSCGNTVFDKVKVKVKVNARVKGPVLTCSEKQEGGVPPEDGGVCDLETCADSPLSSDSSRAAACCSQI